MVFRLINEEKHFVVVVDDVFYRSTLSYHTATQFSYPWSAPNEKRKFYFNPNKCSHFKSGFGYDTDGTQLVGGGDENKIIICNKSLKQPEFSAYKSNLLNVKTKTRVFVQEILFELYNWIIKKKKYNEKN